MSIVRHQPAKILSGAVEANGMVYVAGTVADKRPASVKAQTEEILGKIDALLAQADSHKTKIVSAQIWLAWVDANNLPARACVEAKLAAADMLVEIAVIAAK